MKIIDGRKLAKTREEKLRKKLLKLNKRPKVVSIVVGNDPACLLYTKVKKTKALHLGIDFESIFLSEKSKYQELISLIKKLNGDKNVIGIMVQLPISENFLKGKSYLQPLEMIAPKKDVDGLTSSKKFLPATALAVLSILKDEKIPIKGKNILVVGRSPLVGRPVAQKLKKMGGKVEVVHRQTKDPQRKANKADILISASGVPHLVKKTWVKKGAVVIDVGTTKLNGKIVGDVDFEGVSSKVSKITPVPGGVGPMTVISLMENIYLACQKSN